MPMRTLMAAHDSARAQYDKITSEVSKLRLARDELAGLGKLGTLVDQDDVIKASSKLVAGGIDPHQLAGLLADMPQAPGEPLQTWLQSHAQAINGMLGQIAPLQEAARHQLANSALGVLLAHHMGHQFPAPNPSPSPGTENQLNPAPGPSPGTGPGKFPLPPDQYIEPPPAESPAESSPQVPLAMMTPQGRA